MTTIIFLISFISVIIFSIKLFILYPYYVAKKRNHNNIIPVLCVSFIPVVGFFVSLAWAFSGDIDKNKKKECEDKQITIRGVKLLSFLIISCVIAGFTGMDFAHHMMKSIFS